jgi:hypothetical protein
MESFYALVDAIWSYVLIIIVGLVVVYFEQKFK